MRLRPASLLLLTVWVGVWSVPIDRNNVEQEAKEEETGVSLLCPQVAVAIAVHVLSFTCSLLPLQDTGLYYDRYLREVIEVLETDPHFREKLQTANTEDIKVSTRLIYFVSDLSVMRTVSVKRLRCLVFCLCWRPASEWTSG